MRKSVCSYLLCAAITGSCCAQANTFALVVSDTVSPQHPSVTVQLWALFDPTAWALAHAHLDLFASEDSGGFSNPVIDDKDGACDFTSPGELDMGADYVSGIDVYQFNAALGCFAAPDNPYLILSYTWSTADFSHRVVDLSTKTDTFWLYVDPGDGLGAEYRDNDFAEGRGQILVVPSPGWAAILCGTGAWVTKHRRRRGASRRTL